MIRAHLAAEVEAFGGRFPVFVHTIEHPQGLVLVDTGMIDSIPELDAEWKPQPHRLPDELVSRVALVVNTHLHVAYSFRELGAGATEGQRRVLELGALTWLAHAERPAIPQHRPDGG